MIAGIDLDHVAVAAERWDDLSSCYAGELGGQWVSGGESVGFAAGQVKFANGMKVEFLRPYAVDQNDFLRRFLDRNGPGPHHLTFKVDDIRAALTAAEVAGYRPVNVDLTHPDWKEAFLHPKDAPGVVVQLAQAAGDWTSDPPVGFPSPRHGGTAILDRVVHAVQSLDEGLRLFEGLLAGSRVAEGDHWVELAWPGPGRVRLLQPEDGRLGDRAGRIDHLAFTCPWLEGTRWLEVEGARCFLVGSTGTNPAMGTDDIKGRAKEAVGDLTDDDDLKREGKVDRVTDTVKEKVEGASDKVKDALNRD